MRRPPGREGTDDLSVADMADCAGHPFVPERGAEAGIGRKNGLELLPVLEPEDDVFLLVRERRVAVETDLLGAVIAVVDLEIGFRPRMRVHAARPFLIYLFVTLPALLRAHGMQTPGRIHGHRPLKPLIDDKNIQRP